MKPLWKTWLVVWALGTVVFGLVLAGAGDSAIDGGARFVYRLLGGPAALDLNPVLRFSIGLMGAVSFGWGVTVLALAWQGERAGGPAVWRAVALGFGLWFVLDSAISIHTGMPLNAVSNTLIVLAGLPPLLGGGLLGLRRAER